MRVFIDESGDAGFKLTEGSPPFFVVAMVIFDCDDDARATEAIIANSQARKLHKGEFRFNKCRDNIRDLFFHDVIKGNFRVRAIVVQKNAIYSERFKSDKEVFYEYFVKSLMRNDNGVLQGAKVVIDGSGEREFRYNLKVAIRRRLQEGVVTEVKLKDSEKDSLIQLADMCAGAIARSYRTDRTTPTR
jgi:hypothetical protein